MQAHKLRKEVRFALHDDSLLVANTGKWGESGGTADHRCLSGPPSRPAKFLIVKDPLVG